MEGNRLALTIHRSGMGSDLDSDCTSVARGQALEVVLAVTAEGGKEAHGIHEITPETVEQVRLLVRKE